MRRALRDGNMLASTKRGLQKWEEALISAGLDPQERFFELESPPNN
jgi:hypothetical protein